jgi:hypothetical protein
MFVFVFVVAVGVAFGGHMEWLASWLVAAYILAV